MDTLYDDAELYDLVAADDPEMAGFYVSQVNGRRALELACGTGRLTGPVAGSGAEVRGVDLSEPMLTRARKRVPAARFVRADMRDFELSQSFDTIFIGANSLLHLHSGADFAGLFTALRRHLAPNGRFCFDIFQPSLRLLTAAPDERQHLGDFSHPRGTVTLEETLRYEPVGQVLHATWHWSTADRRDFRTTPIALRQIFPAELLSLLAANGFTLLARYGDFDGSEFTSQSRRQVCVTAPT